MDEEISIIDEKTRNEKIKNFFIKNKKKIISFISIIIILKTHIILLLVPLEHLTLSFDMSMTKFHNYNYNFQIN